MIRWPARFIRKRVSRRLFVLFVLSAFLPLAVIAALSLMQVRALLLQQGQQRLAATAKAYGMTLFERLSLAVEVAGAAAGKRDGARDDSLAGRTFRSLSVVEPGRGPTTLIGQATAPSLAPEVVARLARGKPVVMVSGGSAQPRIDVAVSLAPAAGYAVGELRHQFLWGPSDELPAATDFCVMEDRWKTPLYCSAPMSEAALRGQSSWQRDGETFRSSTWTQFMRAGFGTPDWIVVASQPEKYHLARAVEFGRTYVPVVALTLLLVLWLTLRQSRDLVSPVDKLAARARGIARSEFGERLDLKRDDEFGELATAFDQMSEKLGSQFASLTALAEIDRLILSTQDAAQVVHRVLQRLAEAIPADAVSVTLFDHDNVDHARTHSLDPASGEGPTMVRHSVTAKDRESLARIAGGSWIALSEAEGLPAYLAHLRDGPLASVYVQPIVWRGEACGAIALGYRVQASVTEEERARARELSDRVAVAISSAWRDQQLYHQSHFDGLTGAPNRLLFIDRLEIEIARSQREGLQFALLFIDLDHFKTVNDSYGHSVGDQVLREAVARITRCVRASDTVSRLGGDEFTVLLTSMDAPQHAWSIGESVVKALSDEFLMGEHHCFLSASVGIASYPQDGGSAEQLLKSADTAMYRAKAGGRAQVVFYEERMNAEAVARVTLDRDMRVAIERGELELHYQPQMDLRTGAVRNAEALIRWNHPSRGRISPVRFIPLAEESGFIEQIGQWTLERACTQMKRWRDSGLFLEHVSINVSPRQFRRRSIVDQIRDRMRQTALPASCLQLEITEGLLLERSDAVEAMLHELADMGHDIALDDFGTGFSSMAYVKRFPVHTIKIDRVFIDGLADSPDSQAIVAAIIAMSHALGKTVIAEGVETEAQLALLRELRCDMVQGFLIAPALPAEEFAAFVARHVAVAELAAAL